MIQQEEKVVGAETAEPEKKEKDPEAQD